MSDQSQGPGWWYASDGKWYPPSPDQAAAPDAPPPTATPPAAPADANAPTWDGTKWVYPAGASEAPSAEAPPAAATTPAPSDGQTAAPTDPSAPTWDGTQWVYPTAGASTAPSAAGAPPSSSGKGLMLVVILVVMLVIGAGVVYVVLNRGGSGTAGNVTANAVVSGPDELPSKELTLADKAVVVRGNGGKTLKSVASDGSTFTLDGGADGVSKLGEGSVLLLTGVTVVKIKSVDKSGGDVVVKTEPAAITDVVKDGTLKWDELATGPGTLSVWDGRPEDLEIKDKSQGGSGDGSSGGSSGTSPDGGAKFGPGPVAPGLLGDVPPFGVPGIIASRTQADAITKSGKVGDYTYSYNQTGGLDGSSTYKITITKEGNLLIKLDLDASVDPIISSGDLSVAGSTLDKLHLKTNKFNGKAKVHIEAGTGESVAPIKQEILSLPIEVKYPIVIYGIPFYLGIKGKFLVEAAFTSKNSTIKAQGEASFGGSAGLTWEGGSLSAEGALVTKREDPLKYIDGLGVGVTGMVFAAQFPRVSFGLGYGSSTAGVYLASTTSVGATVASSIGMLPCRQVTITETVSAGADAKFIGIDIPLGKKATAEITKKTWTFYEPKSNACKIEGAEP